MSARSSPKVVWVLGLTAVWLSGCSVGLAERCSADAPCPAGLLCRIPPNDGGTPDASGVCDHPYRAEGEPCSGAGECEPQLTCSNHFAPGTRYGRCTPKREDGAACFAHRDCVSGRCAGASGTELDGTCAPQP